MSNTPQPPPSPSRSIPRPPLAPTRTNKSVHFSAPSPSPSRPTTANNDHDRPSKSIDLLKREVDGGGYANEASPLLSPSKRHEEVEDLGMLNGGSTRAGNGGGGVLSPDDDDDDDDEWEEEVEESKSTAYLFLLTLALGGLQIAWSVELSNGSPYLLGLGISKSLLAFVWIAGPLSGTLVQPYVGIKSDNCRSRFGKRRPFMLGGALATIISLMALAWTREIVGSVLHGIFRVDSDAEAVKVSAIVFAVLMIYVLDFSINVIQAGIRAFIVDNAPAHQQDSANAWASRMSGLGNITGYLFGYINLPKYLWFFGDTQFKVLCVIASITMAITLGISCISITERDPRLEGVPTEQEGGVVAFFKNLFRSIRKLPTQISRVCQVQFVAWIGWFPFLFYITTYIGEIYTEPFFEANPHMSEAETDILWEQGTRLGTRALLIYALTTFSASVVLPFLVASSYKSPEVEAARTPMTPAPPRTPGTPFTPGGRMKTGFKTPLTPGFHTPGGMGTSSGGGYFSYQPASPDSPGPESGDESAGDYFGGGRTGELKKKKSVRRKGGFLGRLFRAKNVEIRWLTLRRAWMLSHVMFAVLMFCTFFVRDITTATILVGLIGVPWAMTNWAPFALIAEEISKRDAIRRGALRPPPTREGQMLADGVEETEGADQAGVVLGIHNVAIAAPQVIATLVSSVIFKALQRPRGEPGDNSVAWVLRFGGCAALIAGWLTRRVGEGEL
ncbi:hypothetical protein LTR10_001616 [Elasticomyces elasticus]|nr:hypothetical protein LTR10_001616 [Elasticomyces elasticus]KAK4975120.1 hypothetical protein LTR42_004330 [Elasticomyces elasticus]